ncbi:MAG: eukaryotic-like serine/threonine-protein kinase, partial [Acidimicrobiaceae bacterium]|nr:eukaryotic-like serine/threonine-protein kinase [Acidimicrobiaceae bacterium]
MGPKQLEDQIADRYQLMEPIGRGGSGVVWRAQDLLLERQVAMKELIPPVGIDEKDRRRLQQSVLREARAAARLHHPGAVSVYDVVNDAERLFIVMELVEAPDLSKVVNWNGPLDPSRAAAIGLELLEVLQVAHESRIIHRDVKPGNVLVPSEGRTRLSDFGIASFVDDPSVTATGILKGTPSYMSPEQAMGGTIGPATDLWSLGATLYFAVEGHAPFDKGGQPIPTMTAIALEEPQPFVRAGALGPVLESLFEKDPADRPVHEVLRRSLQTVQGAGPGPDSSRRYSLGSEEAPYTEVFTMPPELRAPSSASVRPSTAAMDLLATPSTEATSDEFADDQDVAPAIEPAEPRSADLLDA